MFARIHALALVRVVATAVALMSSSAVSNAGPAASHTANAVIIKNFDFEPMSLTVKAGTSVTWKNLDDEPHTVTSVDGLFRSGAIDQNESFTFKFDKPGTYKYLCSIHPNMMASIIVLDSQASLQSPPPTTERTHRGAQQVDRSFRMAVASPASRTISNYFLVASRYTVPLPGKFSTPPTGVTP